MADEITTPNLDRGNLSDPETCEVCGADLDWEECWQCYGEGGFHDCGEDTCCCLDKDELTEDCTECDGYGGYLQCPYLPHKEELAP